MEVNKKELELAARFLKYYAEELGSNGCNDWNFPKDWTEEEKTKFVKDFHDFNGDPEEFDPDHIFLQDYCVASFLSNKLKKLAQSISQEAHQEPNKPRSIDELWVPPSIPLPIKGNKEYEKVEAEIKKDWEGVAEFEKRAPTSTFDVNRMHYEPIIVPKELVQQPQQLLNFVSIGLLGDNVVYVGLTREEAIERWKEDYPDESIEGMTISEFKVKDKFWTYAADSVER